MVEREEEQPEIKVTDKRKFNLDGSLREGVEIEPPSPKPEASAPAAETPIYSPPRETVEKYAAAPVADAEDTTPHPEELTGEAAASLEDEEFNTDDIPGADDPASFVNFLSTLATNAIAALGGMPHPATGQRSLDLETGKFWIDILAMLREKTKGNLHPQESRLLEGILGDLQMQYVQLVRATEEQLKAQAAQKFSAGDILGKK